MFWKIERKKEDDTTYTNDGFNWIQISLLILFIVIVVLITYSNDKINNQVENNLNTKNPIVEGFQQDKKLNDDILKYGDINKEYQPLNDN